MIIPGFFFSLVIALVLSLLFAWLIRRRGPRAGFFWFFILIFLATWAVGIWARPFGPSLWGVYWLTFVIVGVIVALLATLYALRQTPDEPFRSVERREQLSRNETMDMLNHLGRSKKAKELTYVTLGIFFWALLLFLLAIIAGRYLFA
ncbi:MAG: hypothetical protein M0017_10110 [Desulfobacteraceae bacterium]|nr:hypothetical protein [Desulfobacteraceae bacterium]